MNTELIPALDKNNQKVIGIEIGGVKIPFRNQLTFQEFVENYYEHLQISLQILDLAKISGEYKTEWTDEELKNFIHRSNYLQVMILNMLRVNESLNREGILQVIRQTDKQNYQHFSARQLGPQIGGIRIRTNNMKKEHIIQIDIKNHSYSLNDKYRKRIKDFLAESLEKYDRIYYNLRNR